MIKVGLTEKEKQVLQLRNKGLTQIEVAKKLNITQAAVSDFQKNAKQKIIEAQETLDFSKQLLKEVRR